MWLQRRSLRAQIVIQIIGRGKGLGLGVCGWFFVPIKKESFRRGWEAFFVVSRAQVGARAQNG
jgi:hypothetical protein